MTIKVKPLVWVRVPESRELGMEPYDHAEGFGGSYIVEHRAAGHFDMWKPNLSCGDRFALESAAKAAAQAHHEAAIRSQIEEGGDALGSDRASTDTSPGVTAGAVDPAAIWAEALREVLDDMWNLINAIDDEDFHGMVPGRPATIIGHYEEYHRRHIEHAQQIAESLTALIDKEQDHGR